MDQKYEKELMNLEMKNLKHWSTYYQDETEKKEARLKEFGFDKNDLFQSEECEMMFEYLIDIAQKLNLNSIEESSYLMTLNSLFKEKHKNEEAKFNKTQESKKLNDDLKRLNLFYETLKRDHDKLAQDVELKRQVSEGTKQNIDFKQRKIEKYNYEIKKFEDYKKNIDEKLMHESILNKYKEQSNLTKRIEENEEILEEYLGLPPNINLAHEKIDEVKQESIDIEKKIQQYLNILS